MTFPFNRYQKGYRLPLEGDNPYWFLLSAQYLMTTRYLLDLLLQKHYAYFNQTLVSTNHLLVNGIQIYSNEGPFPFKGRYN